MIKNPFDFKWNQAVFYYRNKLNKFELVLFRIGVRIDRMKPFLRSIQIKNSLISRYGFSLLEILIAIGLTGILMLTGLSVISYFMQVRKTQKMVIDQMELNRSLESVLTQFCPCNFAKSGSEKSYSGSGDIAFSELQFYSDTTCSAVKSSVVASSGSLPWSSSGLKINSMNVTNIISKSATDYIGDLQIDFDQTNVPIAPYKTISKPFHFTIDAGTKKFTACSYLSNSGGGGSASLDLNALKLMLMTKIEFKITMSGVYQNCSVWPQINAGDYKTAFDKFNVDGNGKPIIIHLSSNYPGGTYSPIHPVCPSGYLRYAVCTSGDTSIPTYDTAQVLCVLQ